MATGLATELAPTLPHDLRIVTSPSRRAKETAAAIATRLPRTRVEIDPRWQETDVGLAEGLTFDEVATRWPSLADALAAGSGEIDWPDGETAAALWGRIADAWSAVVDTGRETLVVSHGGSIRVAAAIATGRPINEVEFLEPGAVIRLAVDPIRAGATPSG